MYNSPPLNLETIEYHIISSTTNVLRPFFRDHPGELVPEENVWTLWCKGRKNRGRHTDHPAGHHSIQTNQCTLPPSPHFLQAGCPSCHTTNSVKALKTKSTDGNQSHNIYARHIYNSLPLNLARIECHITSSQVIFTCMTSLTEACEKLLLSVPSPSPLHFSSSSYSETQKFNEIHLRIH